jgi:hypothetical protein
VEILIWNSIFALLLTIFFVILVANNFISSGINIENELVYYLSFIYILFDIVIIETVIELIHFIALL